MAHVTNDSRVQGIIVRMRSGRISRSAARDEILAIAPAKVGDKVGDRVLERDETLPRGWLRPGKLFLEWEADEALNAA